MGKVLIKVNIKNDSVLWGLEWHIKGQIIAGRFGGVPEGCVTNRILSRQASSEWTPVLCDNRSSLLVQ